MVNRERMFDVGLASFLGALFTFKVGMINQIVLPIWDGAIYLTNARNILLGQSLYEWFRPPLLSAMTAIVWLFTGENYIPIKYIQLIFTMLAGVVFYIILKRDMGAPFGFAGTLLLMTSTQILLWSDHILVHGISLFFAVLTVLLWRKYTGKRWLLGGITGSLAILARYPTAIIISAVLLAYTINHKKLFLLYGALIGLFAPLFLVYLYSPSLLVELTTKILLKWFGFAGATLPGQEGALFYVLNSWKIFGFAIFLALPVLLLKSTYNEVHSRVWCLWLLMSLAIFSAMGHKELRFTFEWTPAVAYLATLTIAKASKLRLPKTNPVGLRTLLGFTLIILIGINAAYSINTYLDLYPQCDPAGRNPEIARALLKVAEYIKQHTSPNEIGVSDYMAPTLTYFSGRTVYYAEGVKKIEDLMAFLEEGYEPGWVRPTFVVLFPGIGGSFHFREKIDQLGLELEAKIKLSGGLGEAYVFRT